MREPKPFWKKSHECWYVDLDKQQRLDPDKDKAWAMYHELMAGTREIGPNTLVLELMVEFLAHSKRVNAASTHENYKNHLESFYKSVGKIKVSAVKPLHIERWLAKRYVNTNNGSTLNGAVRAVARLFNWAKKSGRIPKSPLEGMEHPRPTTRDVYLMPDQYKKLIEAIRTEAFREFAIVMRETGCRPQEARTVEARHFDGVCWVFPANESKGGTDQRVILLNDKALAITKRLALKYPEGPLFRNHRGRPWTKDALVHQCARMTKRLGFHICPYAIRHTFATDAIIRGVDIVTIAELMGHKSLKMLHRAYQHVRKRGDHLKRALDQATREDVAQGYPTTPTIVPDARPNVPARTTDRGPRMGA